MQIVNRKILSYFFGILAEYYVVLYLSIFGYKLLKHRYKTKMGEIDLIFKKKDNLVAVEVKGRSNKNLNIGDIVGYRQFSRIKNSLKIFLSRNYKYSNFNLRIDIALVQRNLVIKYIKNAWSE
jgi:putative endonuclease